MTRMAAWMAQKLHRACDGHEAVGAAGARMH